MSMWWQRGVIYQIYPISFQDSNGDGRGDLQGIRSRLDYLAWLGVDAIWISPIYPSPMADFGYDVADYCNVAPMFGTLEDFDALITEAHAKNLRVILDFVPNHTSSEHPWFLESKSSRSNPKRNWFIWRDPAPDGGPPNNWISNFGGSAWTLDESTGQYYLHGFLPEQPDLNWRNPAVRTAMYDVLKFWLDRGVDGFRVDVLWMLIKDEGFRDNPPNPDYRPGDPSTRKLLPTYTTDRPEIFDVIAEMRRVVDAYKDRVLIGEIYLPLERLVAYYGHGSGVHLPFNFHLIHAPWNAADVGAIVSEYEQLIPPGEWPNWVLGNHDQPRIGSRIGLDEARCAAMLLLTLRGTPTLYYGDELGMCDLSIPPEQAQDGWAKNEPGVNVSRDPQRTPMQWDASPHAGFTTGKPWLPSNPSSNETNVERLKADPRSMLTLYRRLIELRRSMPVLQSGAKRLLATASGVLAYERTDKDSRLFVALRLGNEPAKVPLPAARGRVVLSTYLDREGAIEKEIELRPHEGVVINLSAV